MVWNSADSTHGQHTNTPYVCRKGAWPTLGGLILVWFELGSACRVSLFPSFRHSLSDHPTYPSAEPSLENGLHAPPPPSLAQVQYAGHGFSARCSPRASQSGFPHAARHNCHSHELQRGRQHHPRDGLETQPRRCITLTVDCKESTRVGVHFPILLLGTPALSGCLMPDARCLDWNAEHLISFFQIGNLSSRISLMPV